MSLRDSLTAITNTIQAVPVASRGNYRRVRTAQDVGGQFADRLFELKVMRRLGPEETGLYPMINYECELVLQLVPGDVDVFADMQRLAEESHNLARALEADPATTDHHVIVRDTVFSQNDNNDIAVIRFTLFTREN